MPNFTPMSKYLFVILALLSLTTGCGGGGGGPADDGGPAPLPEPVVAESSTDIDGEAIVTMDGAEYPVKVEDGATGEALRGVRVIGASNGTQAGFLVVDESGRYAALMTAFDPAPALSNKPALGEASITLPRLIELFDVASDVAARVQQLQDLPGPILDALLDWAKDWAIREGHLQWGERVPLGSLHSTLEKDIDEIWTEYGRSLISVVVTSLRDGQPVDKRALWRASLILYERQLGSIGQDIIYRGYRHRCYADTDMMTVYRIGPVTLNVVPDGPPSDAPTGDTVSLSGVITDRLTGDPIEGADLRLMPAEAHATTDAQGRYNFIDVDIGCAPLANWFLVASQTGFKTRAFFDDALQLAPDTQNIFNATLGPDLTFQGVGDLPGGTRFSIVYGISADGSTILGESISTAGTEAIRWTDDDGIQGLGSLPGFFSSSAGAASADGSVIGGWSNFELRNGLTGNAFLWTADGGMTAMGYLPGGSRFSAVYGISNDGMTVVGQSHSASGTNLGFRWTAATGFADVGDLPGGQYFNNCGAISGDGKVIVGWSYNGSGRTAFRMTGSTLVASDALGDFSGGTHYSTASGVSYDGSVVVGHGTSGAGITAFRWTRAGGMESLGDFASGNHWSSATDVSGDGSIVVGIGTTASGEEAFIWDATNGMRNLRDVLINEYGVNLTGWRLTRALAISDDGTRVCGLGSNPDGYTEGWVVDLDVR